MIRLLALACGLLTLVVVMELTYPLTAAGEPGQAAGVAGHALPKVMKPAVQAAPAINLWADVALARPLFAPDRKPVAGVMAADPGMPRLAGIIASPDGAVAIFQPNGNGRSITARTGERLGGWQVTAIAAGEVDLSKDNKVVVLRPRFAGLGQAEHGGTATQTAKQSGPRWEVAAPSGLLRARWSNPQLQP